MNQALLKSLLFASVCFGFSSAKALNVCTMTFNSEQERQALQSVYREPQHKVIELVPANKDPQWLQKACAQKVKCDILMISGHFGGLFFGEKTIPTLQMSDMLKTSCDQSCPGIFENVKAVYLMGCNTLATKKADHRTIEQYLRVLVGDGFPLENAELVAASRYAQYGASVENQMRMIFPKAKTIFGFDSTSPVGVTAGPLLKKALVNTPPAEREVSGASSSALLAAFKGMNPRSTVADSAALAGRDLRCAVSTERTGSATIRGLFAPGKIRDNFDVALAMTDTRELSQYLQSNASARQEFIAVGTQVLQQTRTMLGLQKKVFDLYLRLNLISENQYRTTISQAFENMLYSGLDYIRAEQLCHVAETSPLLERNYSWGLGEPGYDNFHSVLSLCFKNPRGQAFKSIIMHGMGNLESCLIQADHVGDDWNCLTSYQQELNVSACLFAAQRNPDIENGDDMRWYCWDRLRNGKINQAQCLTLSKSMNVLGNRIKSNWNCMNQVRN